MNPTKSKTKTANNPKKDFNQLKWLFGNEWNRIPQKHKEALNRLIIAFNDLQSGTLRSNTPAIKLIIEMFLQKTEIERKGSGQAIKEIIRLLELPLSHYHDKMKEQIPLLRFALVTEKYEMMPTYYKSPDGKLMMNNYEKRREHNEEATNKNMALLEKALNTPYTDQELKTFLDESLLVVLTNREIYR